MRWVNRGAAPDGVDGYARQFTQGWIDHFRNRSGRPTDYFWSQFRPELGRRFGHNCGYCERECDTEAEVGGRISTVDHFVPLNYAPERAYDWLNWIFSCRRCNGEYKQGRWPDVGFVDPCAYDATNRPDQYFDYLQETGEITAKPGLTEQLRQRANTTIGDIGLNELDVRFYRFDWIRTLREDLMSLPISERQALVEYYVQEPVEFAGITAIFAEQLRQAGEL